MADLFYCDLQDVLNTGLTNPLLIQLTNDTKAEEVNEECFDGCRKAAMELINSFAMAAYSGRIPFNPVPETVRTIAASLTKYFLYQRKNGVDDKIQKLYDSQVGLLKMIANGTIKLLAEAQQVTQDGISFTAKSPEDRVSHPDNLTGYIL